MERLETGCRARPLTKSLSAPQRRAAAKVARQVSQPAVSPISNRQCAKVRVPAGIRSVCRLEALRYGRLGSQRYDFVNGLGLPGRPLLLCGVKGRRLLSARGGKVPPQQLNLSSLCDAMRKLPMGLMAGLALFQLSVSAEWLTDLSKAQTQAKAEKKTVLINFTGSDW